MRKLIANNNQLVIGKNMWNKWIPKKGNIFAWRAQHERLAVKETLNRMGMGNGILTFEVCKLENEPATHALVNCYFAKDIWNSIRVWWNLSMCNGTSIEDVLLWLQNDGKNSLEKRALNVIGVVALVRLWHHRNEATFNNRSKKTEAIFLQIQKEALMWIESRASKVVVDRSLWFSTPRLAVTPL